MSCGVGRRRGLDLALLWLWRRSAATAPIRPLAWEPPYAVGGALKKRHIQKLNILLTLQHSNCTPWYLSEGVECKNLHTNVYSSFIVALFITIKTWKQPRYLSVGE